MDKSFFGQAFEHAIGLDLAVEPPHPELIDCLTDAQTGRLLTLAGYWFGSIPAVEHNFTLVILAIVFISLLPPLLEYVRSRRRRRAASRP